MIYCLGLYVANVRYLALIFTNTTEIISDPFITNKVIISGFDLKFKSCNVDYIEGEISEDQILN